MATPAPGQVRTGKERLLAAADALFAESGYGEVGVAAILERAGVQAPTLYHHFGDKEGLYVAWAERALRRVSERLRQDSAGGLPSIATALWNALEFDLGQALRDASRLAKPESRERVVTAYFEAVYEPIVVELVRGISAGELRAEPVAPLVEAFLGGLLALKRQGAAVETARWWVEFYMRGLRV